MVDRPMFMGGLDPITLNRMERMVANITSLQRQGLNRSSQADPRRDLDDECGYPKLEWTGEEYHDFIMSEPAAAIVNMLYPLESWKVSPKIYEVEESDSATEFEAAWDELPTMLGVEPSYYSEEQGSHLISFLLNADVLMGEGRHGVILIGLDDGKELSEPATPKNGQKITFLQAFPEQQARINAFEYDRSKPRYGQPVSYQIQFANPLDSSQTSINEPNETRYVHWSRIVHLTDTWHMASSSRVYAVPRCRPVRNPLLDIRKCRGSSAEIYYKGGFGGHHFGTIPTLGADVDVDVDDLRSMYEQYVNGLQRGLFTSGMTVDPLAPDTTDPTPYILTQIEAIAMFMRCPKRKLIGNETGERATEDDTKDWAGRLSSRQQRHNTAKMIVPFTDRLINLGVLPKPKQGYRVDWPDLYSMSDTEKATVLLQRTQAYAAYVSGGVESIVPPLEYMTKFDNMEEEEAEAILESAQENQEVLDQENQDLADEHGLVPEVEGFKEPEPDPVEVAKAKASVTKNIEDAYLLVNGKKLGGGEWKTIKGQHVYMRKGKIIAGGSSALRKDVNKEGGGDSGGDKKDKPIDEHHSHEHDSNHRKEILSHSDSKEHALLADSKGNVLSRTHGDEDAVQFPKHHTLDDSTSKLHQHHNHPYETPPSLPDVLSLSNYKGLHSLSAHTPTLQHRITRTTEDLENLAHTAKKVYDAEDKVASEHLRVTKTSRDQQKSEKAYADASDRALQKLKELGLIDYKVIKHGP